MFHKILLMSLLSVLFGCSKRSASKERFADVPHFPVTDNSACKVEPVLPDSNFFAATFLLAPDRKSVFVVAHHMAGRPMYQLLRFDERRQVQVKTELSGNDPAGYPVFWWDENGQLVLAFDRLVLAFDPVTLQEKKRWNRSDFAHFLTKKERDQLTYNEQDDAYQAALQSVVGKSRSAYVRYIPVSNVYFLMLEFAALPAEAWLLRDKDEADTWIEQVGQRVAAMNPGSQWQNDVIEDQGARLALTTRDTFDYKIVYPNIKNIEAHLYELTSPHGKTTRFRLSNKEKRSLVLQVSDNEYLCTENGAVWLLYEGQVYRVDV